MRHENSEQDNTTTHEVVTMGMENHNHENMVIYENMVYMRGEDIKTLCL